MVFPVLTFYEAGSLRLMIPTLVAYVSSIITICGIVFVVTEYRQRKKSKKDRFDAIKNHLESEISNRAKGFEGLSILAREALNNATDNCEGAANCVQQVLSNMPKDTYSSLMSGGYLIEGYAKRAADIIDYYSMCQVYEKLIMVPLNKNNGRMYLEKKLGDLRFLILISKKTIRSISEEESQELSKMLPAIK